MIGRNRTSFAWKGALTAALVATACGKVVSDHGGESHFQCMGNDDCHASGEVCVRAAPADETGECRPLSEVTTGTADSGTYDSGAGGSSSEGGGSSAGSGGTTGAGAGGTRASNFGGAAGGPIVFGQCASACCWTNEEACFATVQGSYLSGRECQALRENTGESRIQLRLTSTKTLLPEGLAIPIIQQARNTYTHLPLDGANGTPNCYGTISSGGGRFIQLLDIDLGSGSATAGFSRFLRSETVASELANGLCVATGEFLGNPAYRLDGSQMSDAHRFPAGFPLPGGLADSPWSVRAVNYVRSDADFDLRNDHAGPLEQAPNGIYFYDEAKGRYHSYAPLIYTVQYGSGSDAVPLVIPIREAEATLSFNDPERPNCVGAIFQPDVAIKDCAAGANWVGAQCRGDGTCNLFVDDGVMTDQGYAEHTGYMLITELEQIYEPALATTLCVTMLGRSNAEASGWLSDDGRSCRSARWDPQAPNNEGLPIGDWCAATNSPATATCHDAFRLRERTTFSATKVKIDPVSNHPAACPIQ